MKAKTIQARAQEYYNVVFDRETLHLMDVAEGLQQPTRREREDGITDEDSARELLEQHGYGIDSETVYYVTLAGGGPAARLRVTVDEYGEVETASLQFQDWFEPWTDAPRQDYELVERYARLIGYYGEGV